MSATTEVPGAFRHAAGEQGPVSLVREGIADVRSRERLVRYLVSAEMHKRGADTLLGNIWWVLDPLLQMLVYLIFVTIITNRQLPAYPLFIFAAILPWKWFTASVGDSTVSVVSQGNLIKQIAFPKIVLPVSATTAGVVGFTFGLIPLLALMLFYQDRITIYLLFLPVIAFVQFVFTMGICLLVAAGNVFFRDLGNVSRHILRLWWFLSPGLYSLATVGDIAVFHDHPSLKVFMQLNPFAILFEAYHDVIYGTTRPEGPPTMPNLTALSILFVVSVFLLGLGIYTFKRLEPNFAKVL
jgi:ABC-type polysaccharide/polyol phosphate export permease